MKQRTKKFAGSICLIGAGPGDPGLLTLKGLDRLRRAQVVVYDALVARALLAEAAPDAELIDVGKRGGKHLRTQDQINALLVAKARAGRAVVRLKGGDPYVFGRGAEEAAYAAAHGLSCEVIPGITSGLAAPALAGIPVTHRRVASTVTLVTGHERPGKSASAVDYHALAALIRAGGTVCFYMGVSRLGDIVRALTAAGARPNTPLAGVQWGTTSRQRSVRSTLTRAEKEVAAAGLGAPAIIVVGKVAGLRDPGWNHFTSRPLFGQCVLVTRTRTQASELRIKLEERGARVLEAATIELTPAPAKIIRQVDQALRHIEKFDWLVLTSVNGVAALAQRLTAIGGDARTLAGVKIAAIGGPTAQALREQLGLRADLMPKRFVAEALAEELIARRAVRGRRFLLLRADIARPVLPGMLTKAGGLVTELPVYQTRPAPDLPAEVREALRCGEIDWVTVTSSSTIQNLVTLLGPDVALLQKVKIASIGPITTRTIRDLGLRPTVQARRADLDGLVAAMCECGC